MLMDRIVGAFTFRRQVYAEVENDTSFTTTAWIIVAIVGAIMGAMGIAAAGVGSLLGGG